LLIFEGAGTDSNIFVELIGEHGHTPRLFLNHEVSHDKKGDLFEKGRTDTFEVQSIDIGKVKNIYIILLKNL